MTVFCPLCSVYCPDTAAHEAGKNHLQNVEKALSEGRSVPPIEYGVLEANSTTDKGTTIGSSRYYAPQVRPQLTPVVQPPAPPAGSCVSQPMPPPGLPPNAIYCSICNVWSGSLVAHNTHVKGKRHAKKEAGQQSVVTPVSYENDAIRQEQEMYKKQYVCLVTDVLCYIRHMRGLVKAEFEFEKVTVNKRINEWHPEKLSQEGYAWFDARSLSTGTPVKKAECVFGLQPSSNWNSDVLMGCTVYITPTTTPVVDLNDRNVTMMGEVTLVTRDKMVVKNLTGKNKPWIPSPSYRIDLGVTSVPTERMRSVLLMIKRQHLEKLRSLGIQDRIDSKDYFSDDDDDISPIEGKVNQMGIFEPFSTLAWCAFHDVQRSVNGARKMIHEMFSKYNPSSSYIKLASEIMSGMVDLGTRPVALDASAAAKQQHHQYVEFVKPSPGMDLARFSHRLNTSQVTAVGKVIDEGRKLTLIQGPPGTGKTTTAIAIICEWVRKCNGTILATAHSNAGLDNLMQGLLKKGVKCLRVGKSSNAALEDYSLDAYVQMDLFARDRSIKQTKLEEIKVRMGQADQTGESMALLGKEYKEIARQLKTTLSKTSSVRNAIRESEVICATCIGAGSQVLTGVSFPFVLLDEATQATEPASLVPVCRGSVQVVLIGDQAQLPPTVLNYEAAKRGLDVSLFDRLLGLGLEHHVLDTQYRMHPFISEFSNENFYQGRIENGVTAIERTMPTGSLPNDWPVSFTHVVGKEVMQGKSRANIAEAKSVINILSFVGGKKISWADIGIITPYSAQVRCIKNEILRVLGAEVRNQIEVNSVDGFQGREKHVIILSLVRSDPSQHLGFVSEWRRINVSLTRAKYGLFVTGHIPTLLKSPLWCEWLQKYHDRAMVFDVLGQQLTLLELSMREFILAAQRPKVEEYRDMKVFGDSLVPCAARTDPNSTYHLPVQVEDVWASGAGSAYTTLWAEQNQADTAVTSRSYGYGVDVVTPAAPTCAPPAPPKPPVAEQPPSGAPMFTPPPVPIACDPPSKKQRR